MTRTRKYFALALIVFSGLTTSAFAQLAPPGATSQTGDPRKDARIHVGPFYVTPALLIDRLGVDTNVFNAAGEQKSDLVVGVVPQATVWLPIYSRALITTTLSSGVTYYKTFSEERSVDPGVKVRGEVKMSRLTPFADVSYSQSRRQPNDEIEIRVPITASGVAVGFAYQVQSKLSLELSAHREGSGYGRDAAFLGANLRERLSKHQQGVRLRLTRKLTSLTTIHAVAENVQDKFEFSPNRDAAGVRLAVGAGFGLKALVTGQAEVGFRSMDPVDAVIPSFRGLVAQAGLGYKIRGATAVHLDWNRDVHFSHETIRPYYVLNAMNFTVRRQLAGRFDGIAGLGRNSSSYVRLSEDIASIRAVSKSLSLDIGYRLNRDARLGFAVTRTSRTSEPPTGRDYSGIRAGLSFSVGF